MRGAVCAVNGLDSHSGTNALRGLVAPASREGRFFSEIKVTGTHAASIALVQNGEADVAAIDCVTHALIGRYRGEALKGTRVLGSGASRPLRHSLRARRNYACPYARGDRTHLRRPHAQRSS